MWEGVLYVRMDSSSITSADAGEDHAVLDGAVQLGGLAAGLYGPGGRDKLVVTDGEAVVTGDLHQLFDTLDLAHPGARIAANAAVEQKETAGDGSTAVALLIGALGDRADDLLAKGMHRATIAKGFHRGQRAAVAAVADLGTQIADLDDPRSRAAIRASLGRATELDGSVEAVIEAARLTQRARDRGTRGIGVDHVEFHHRTGASAPAVEFRRGLFLEREPVTPNTARQFEDARIAVLGGGKKAGHGIEERELKRTGGSTGKGRTEVTLQAETPEDLEAFRQHEVEDVKAQVQALVDADVDVVFTTMGISDRAIAELDKAGITAFRSLQAPQARRVSRATGARIVMGNTNIGPEDVGSAGRVTVESADETYVRIEECAESEVGTLVITGALRYDATSIQRALMSGISTGRTILQGTRLVPGGGGTWMQIAAAVRDEAKGVGDRSAVAMDEYAEALEELPRTLVRNAGGDPIDTLTRLRASGASGVFDADEKVVRDAGDRGPFDLAPVVESAVTAASDVVIQLVRIDDTLPAADDDDEVEDDYDFRPDPERDVA